MRRQSSYPNRRFVRQCGAVVAATIATLSFTATAAFAAPGDVTTLAGSGTAGGVDGPGTTAAFNHPSGVAVDSSGNVFVAGYWGNNIRKVTPSGVVSTFATGFNEPFGIAIDSSNNLYVADRNNLRIAKVTPSGVVSTLAGTGSSGSTDGPAGLASFSEPLAVAVDSAGIVYVAEGTSVIRKISGGIVSTLAGQFGASGYLDATGTAARFVRPHGIAVDPSGVNVYVADNLGNRIRKISASGVVSTLAGSGAAGFLDSTNPLTAQFNTPTGIAVDATGNLYIGDISNHRIRKIAANGNVTTIAGDGTPGWLDANGISAKFNSPVGVALGSSGELFVADVLNNRVRTIANVGSPPVVPTGGIVVTPNPATAGAPLLLTPQAGCVTAMGTVDSAVSYFILSSTGEVVQQITVPAPPSSPSVPVNANPINTPGSYTVIVGTSATNPFAECSGAFVVAADGTVPIVDPRVGGAAAVMLGGGFLLLRRRRQSLAKGRA
jgi:serine/threonine protein kinase, bacterial